MPLRSHQSEKYPSRSVYVFTVFGSLKEGFLGKELLDLIHNPLPIGIAIRLDCCTTTKSVKRRLPGLHGFDRCFEIRSHGLVLQSVPQVERTRALFLGA